MHLIRQFSFAVLALCSLWAGGPSSLSSVIASDLIFCGMDEVFVADPKTLAAGKLEKKWSWFASDQKNLPASLVKTFRTTDECKPIHDGRQILITSSGGGCALVDFPSGEVKWHAFVGNAHSIELLPKNRVVVAGSTNKAGNRLALFDLKHSGEPLWTVPLISAHGVVWDPDRKLLWALGLDDLQCYSLGDWESDTPTLKLEHEYPLPDRDGHDLLAVPGGNDLVVTTGKTVLLFDRDKREFREHPELKGQARVKSVAIHPHTGKTFFIQGSAEHWWSDKLQSPTSPTSITVPGERLYKARWLPTTGALTNDRQP